MNLPAAPASSAAADAVTKDEEKAADQAVNDTKDDLAAATERFRTTAKWLVTTFGALAAAIVTGLKLSDLGKLEGDDQTFAAISAAVALLSVAIIVMLAARVLAAGRVALSDVSGAAPRNKSVADALNSNPALFGPYGNVGTFAKVHQEMWEEHSAAVFAALTEKDAAKKAAAQKVFDETKNPMRQLNRLNSRILAVARHEQVRIQFERAMKWTAVLSVIAGIGITSFALVDTIADKPASPEPAVDARPVTATADLTSAGEEKLRSVLGAKCDLNKISTVALASGESGVELVSLPTPTCKMARFTLAEDDGEVVPAELELPES